MRCCDKEICSHEFAFDLLGGTERQREGRELPYPHRHHDRVPHCRRPQDCASSPVLSQQKCPGTGTLFFSFF